MILTKLIATLGPGSDSLETVGRLIDEGVDVFRLNFSHGTHESHARALAHIREACKARRATVAVMGDLCGPKIRVGEIAGGSFTIAIGNRIELVAGPVVGDSKRISTSRPQLASELKPGERVLIDDGQVRLRVEGISGGIFTCICEVGGNISSRKGVNLPDSRLKLSAMTDKDRADAKWMIANGLDYVALSFVREAADIAELRGMLPLAEAAPRVVVKIETPAAIERLEEIIEGSDVVLVARGDLGVEMDLAGVPLIQKRITRMCRSAGKPVIIATQMLQSMVSSPTPTRAEVSDVANAVLDYTDAVMLSAETAVGKYPVESVQMLARVCQQTECFVATLPDASHVAPPEMRRVTTAVAHGADLLARDLGSKLVAVWTETGNTARLLSKHRLAQLVVGLSPDEHVCRRMSMYYGVRPMPLHRRTETDAMLADVDAALLREKLAAAGDMIVVIAGTHLDEPGATNALLIHLVRP